MKIHYIQHASFEGVGMIANWAYDNGHTLQPVRPYAGEELPDVDNVEFLLIMGGPQSPIEKKKCSYITHEIEFTAKAINKGIPVLGFCLGAQIISEALGGKTMRSPEKEVGILPIELTNEGVQDTLFSGFPRKFEVIHWHNDMPSIPKGGTLLASSQGCPNQAFRFGDRVYGLQFHMEITREGVLSLAEHCPDNLHPSKYTQTVDEFLKGGFESIHERMRIILHRLTEISQQKQSKAS